MCLGNEEMLRRKKRGGKEEEGEGILHGNKDNRGIFEMCF